MRYSVQVERCVGDEGQFRSPRICALVILRKNTVKQGRPFYVISGSVCVVVRRGTEVWYLCAPVHTWPLVI